MLMTIVAPLLRWLGATAVGIGVVILGAMVARANPLALALLAAVLVLAPLAIARRFPSVGSWLAPALLVSAPFAVLMIAGSTNAPLILSHERCGTAEAGLWLFVMPLAQAILALGGGVLWRLRHRLGRVWAPATMITLGLTAAMLLSGAYRYFSLGSVERARDVVAQASAQQLPAVAADSQHTAEVSGLVVHRACEQALCELSLGLAGTPPDERAILPRGLRLDTTVTIHSIHRWRIVEATGHHARSSAYHAVFDVERGRLTDLELRDVTPWFGPSGNALAMLLLAAGLVLGSALLPATRPLVWRRLGALQAPHDPTLEEVVALRSMHVAVLVVASLPLCAYVILGAVF